MAPWSGGLQNKFLVALGERMENNEMKQLERMGMAYIRAKLPSRFDKVWLSLKTSTLHKSSKIADMSPTGFRKGLVKKFHREVINQSKIELLQ